MRFSTAAVIIASAGIAAAQTATVSAPGTQSSCAADNVVQVCLTSEGAKTKACSNNDWVCLCRAYEAVLTCYNNCPNDPARNGVQSQVTSFCGAAGPELSSISAAASTRPVPSSPASTGSAGSPAGTTGATSAGGSPTGSSTNAAFTATRTGAANAVAAPVGGILAVVFGIMGML